MPKTKISEYSSTANSNTDISGINIDEGCAPSGINNAIRTLMAQLKDWQSGTSGDYTAIAAGGTGAGTAATARTALGLAIGTNVQAWDADLDTWATKTAPSGTAVGTTDTQTLTNKTLTTPTLTTPTVTDYVESVVAIGNTGTAKTIALTSGTVQTATLTGNCTFTMPTATAGKSFILLLKQDATGSRTATFTGVKFNQLGAPTITVTANKMDILTFVADGTNWYGSYSQGYTP
jgi:hypothetical protein